MNRLAMNAALLAAFAATTALGQAIPDRPEKLTYPAISFQVPKAKDAKVVLKNKVPAYLVADPSGVPLVRVTVSWRGGAYLDPAGKEGLASLFGSQLAVGGTRKTDAAKLEDRLVALAAQEHVPSVFLAYLNRLSDLLFVLARAANHRAGVPETAW